MYTSPGGKPAGRKSGEFGEVDGVTRIFARSLRSASSGNGTTTTAAAVGLFTSGGGGGGGGGTPRTISIAGAARAAAGSPYQRAGRERPRRDAIENRWGHDMYDPFEGDQPMTTKANGTNRGATWAGKAARNNQEDLSKRRLLVENLHYEVLEDDLKELFGSFGTVVKLVLHYDTSGRSEGRAEITFADSESAKSAVNTLNNRLLDGQPMQIKFYVPPPRTEFGMYSSGRAEKKGGIFARLGGVPTSKFGRATGGGRRRDYRRTDRQATTMEELAAEMDAYMKG